MKRLVILNPTSRHGTAGRLFARQRGEWERVLGRFELYETGARGDATGIVRRTLREGSVDQILVAGGDGSIHEALCGYWDGTGFPSRKIPLGILNLGTGGDFHRTVRSESDDYLAALVENRFRHVDVATVSVANGEARPFLNIASTGMAGEVLQSLKGSRFQAGAAGYFFHTFKVLLAYSPKRVEITTVDGNGEAGMIEADIFNLFVCNGRFSGGGMEWAPSARLESGLLQVTLVSGHKKWPLVLQSAKVYRGQIDSFPGARTFAAREVIVSATNPLSLETDGEIAELTEETSKALAFRLIERVFPLVL